MNPQGLIGLEEKKLILIAISLMLTTITWNSTHILDPKKEIESSNSAVNIQVISLDWKWLFIYPDYNIATINEIAFPKNVPIKFNITSNSVMNSFFIPQLGGQIYAMAGMNSILHLISNSTGKYKGISANFSGPGFSGMKFIAISLADKNSFDDWIQNIQKSPKTLENIQDYKIISTPSVNHPVEYFSRD
uniref:cytochrome-c oxidase n=1 Tax=Glossina pallidipes TaxID=7398 RepID=A0A1A9Z164_GLOPL